MKILLLEDNFAGADSMLRAFALYGYDADHAKTVADARALYEPDKYDVMILDYEVPDGTGLDFLATIRGSDKAVTIINSGLDRSREIEASGLHVDHAFSKSDVDGLFDVLTGITATTA